jgi:two-component system invasion response regulator UvrY
VYRVLLVDDHPVVRKGMKAILADGLPGVVVGEAGDGDELLAQLPEGWDVVVLDLNLPGRSGIDLLVEVKHRHPKLPVLIMSLYGEEQFAVRALKGGAAGYLSKATAPENLVNAVVKVARGGRYVTEALAERLAGDVGGATAETLHELLSNREFEVLRAIASGKTASEIAATMNLSVKTVSTYRARLLEKMQMSTNAELTRYAIEKNLV